MIWGTAIAVFVAAAIGTALFRRLAIARGWVAQVNARSSHQGAIPVGAGIVVLGVSLVAAWPLASLGWGYLAGALLLGAVSGWDDRYAVPVSVRLSVQVLAAVALLVGIGAHGHAPLQLLMWPLLVLWIVGSINAYNFMDGIDGMAGLQAVVAGSAWYWLGSRFALSGHAQLGLVLAAASAGFLLHNLPKARVFLGDTGSVFLGYSFAALTVTTNLSDPIGPLFVSSALFLWPLFFDSGFTLLRRWRSGQRLTEAHRDHLYQRLVKSGVSHVRVSLAYAGLSILGVVAGRLLLFASVSFSVVAGASLVSLAFLLWSWVRHCEQRPQSTSTVPS
jgi:UDP-N-acetylmuramyl pentapeptide phosphotransferase/UDP-N-acetylglucosamine-1-phosphate transferase